MKLFRLVPRSLAVMAAAVVIAGFTEVSADSPTDTRYNAEQCRGSSMPYPAPNRPAEYPDSLTPVLINHVGRHGARFPANSRNVDRVLEVLGAADSCGTITPLGRELMKLATRVRDLSAGHWGALDSLGMAEQRGIAARMYAGFPQLFNGTQIDAISSYAPRCVMSMYSFLHQITRLNNRVEVSAASGRQYSPLLRFFDLDKDYLDYGRGDSWRESYNEYCLTVLSDEMLRRFTGEGFDTGSVDVNASLLSAYSVVAGTAAMGLDCDPLKFFNTDELNALWSCFNLRQYMLHSCSTLSSTPMEIASPLLNDLINSTDRTISDIAAGKAHPSVRLRFGHAETLMPLLALMRLHGCYYLTNFFDTVGLHWRDFDIVPMAANLQMILFKSESGRYYLRVDLNEKPIPLIPGSDDIYVSWGAARGFLENCIPIYFQD